MSMHIPTPLHLAACVLALAAGVAHAAAFQPAPPAQLHYAVKARQRGFDLTGASIVNWQAQDGKYRVQAETSTSLFGRIVESSSEGAIDEQGLAPAVSTEKRIRKAQTTATFRRDSKVIAFSDSGETHPLKGGEQDRDSILWQIAGQARANPGRFAKGSEHSYVVAGPRRADTWRFRVVGPEKVVTPHGAHNTVHLTRVPADRSQEQQVDVWFAQDLEWYPVRLRYTDQDGDYIEQTLERVAAKQTTKTEQP